MTTPKSGPKKLTEKEIDEEVEESFPASDPPSWTPGEIKHYEDVEPESNTECPTDQDSKKK